MKTLPLFLLSVAIHAALCTTALAAKPRARDLGIPFDGTPGAANAITDVSGVAVGYSTLIQGDGAHAVRTGVTAVLPRGKATLNQSVFADAFSLNGNGELTGSHWIEEGGTIEGPVMITNTHSVGTVRDAVIQWRVKQGNADASGYWWSLPVVAETWDGELNDVNGFHVKSEHVFSAIEGAHSGSIMEGNVGGGTGMICHEYKCGTGTSSRLVQVQGARYVIGALVQANYGVRDELRVAGVPVGKYMRNDLLRKKASDDGSIIIVVATDAPLMPHQLKRVARRASLGLARNGSYAGNGSGDIFLAFSTANAEALSTRGIANVRALGNDDLDPVFLATVQAVEESVVNALVAAETMIGVNGNQAVAIDHKELRDVLRKHARLKE